MSTAKTRDFRDDLGPDHHVANVRYLMRELGDLPGIYDLLGGALMQGLTIDQILPLCLDAVDSTPMEGADEWHWHNRRRSAKYSRPDSLAAKVSRDYEEAEEALSVVNGKLDCLEEQKRAIVEQIRNLQIEQDGWRDMKKLCKSRFLRIVAIETGKFKIEFSERIKNMLNDESLPKEFLEGIRKYAE